MSHLVMNWPVNPLRSPPQKCVFTTVTVSTARLNVRSRRRCQVRASLLGEIAAVSEERFKTVVAAAVAVPFLMFGMAVGAAFLLKRRVKLDAMSDLEDYIKLVEEGMDEETAKNTILSRIEIIGPDLRKKRKRRQVQAEEQSDELQVQQQQQQPEKVVEEETQVKEKVEASSLVSTGEDKS